MNGYLSPVLAGVIVIVGLMIRLLTMAPVTEEEKIESYIDEEYQKYAIEIADKYSINHYLVIAMIEAESSGRRKVVSKAGCVGLMQINPKWHKERMDLLGVTDLKDAYGNILVGCDFLAELFYKYEDVYAVLMAYNEGEYGGAIKRAAEGKYSDYALRIVERAKELKGEEKWEEKETLK